MQLSGVPGSWPLYWGQNAGGSYIRNIPVNSQIGITPGAASLNDGYVPLNFQPPGSGGVPPFGQDANGITRQLSQWAQWQEAGAPVQWNSTFESAIGGYPLGALLRGVSYLGWWESLVDSNTTNPDSGGAGWIAEDGGATTLASAATTDLGTVRHALVTITGTTTITNFGTVPAGVLKTLVFAGIVTLTYNATSLILPGAANITTAANDVAMVRSLGGGNWQCVGYQRASGAALVGPTAGSVTNSQLANMAAGTVKGNVSNTSAAPSDLTGQQVRALPNVSLGGHLFGLTLSNDATTPATVLDIAAGEAASQNSTYPTLLVLPTAFTKSISTAWASGSGNGALDTGSFANTTYHIYVIDGPSVATDILASVSASNPSLPGGYTLFRRVGSVVVQSSAILAFVQTGDDFYWNTATPPNDIANGLSKQLVSLTVPIGLRVLVYIQSNQVGINAGTGYLKTYDGANANISAYISTNTNTAFVATLQQYTNTNAQIYAATSNGSATTIGYRDTRGRY